MIWRMGTPTGPSLLERPLHSRTLHGCSYPEGRETGRLVVCWSYPFPSTSERIGYRLEFVDRHDNNIVMPLAANCYDVHTYIQGDS